eukprot:2640552-Amphidinium_carterae.1
MSHGLGSEDSKKQQDRKGNNFNSRKVPIQLLLPQPRRLQLARAHFGMPLAHDGLSALLSESACDLR